MKNILLLITLSFCWSDCGESIEKNTPADILEAVVRPNSETKERPSLSKHNRWDGFYFWGMGMGSVLVIHDGKYYNFGRTHTLSLRKDYEYDIAFELNQDGLIPLVKEYYLDRDDKLVSKEKILFDTEPIIEGEKAIGMKYRGKKHDRMSSLGEYFSNISVDKAAVVQAVKQNSKYQDDVIIEQALKETNFIKKSKITTMHLRQEVEFWRLVVNVIKADS